LYKTIVIKHGLGKLIPLFFSSINSHREYLANFKQWYSHCHFSLPIFCINHIYYCKALTNLIT